MTKTIYKIKKKTVQKISKPYNKYQNNIQHITKNHTHKYKKRTKTYKNYMNNYKTI